MTDMAATRHGRSGRECLPDLLWALVHTHPESPAVAYGAERLTYRELGERSSTLAAFLRYLGAAPDDPVGLFVEPSIELVVSVWGILLSGSAYLPLLPEYPEERLRSMVEDARARIIVAQEGLRAALADCAPPGTRIVTLEDAAAFAARHERPELGVGLDPSSLAYVIYTSGSTGRPKGVMIEHRSIVSQMRWLHDVHGLDQKRVVLLKTPMSFDAAQWEILAPGCGSRVVVAGPGAHRDPRRLIEIIVEHGVTTLQCVPTLLRTLLDTDELHRCTSLTQVFSGGEVLSRSLAVRCLEVLPGRALVNLYGPTECTINASSFSVDPRTVREGPDAIPIGTPVQHTRFYVLDGRLSPVPAGEIGELYISGVQLARGYLHRPDLTAERFVDNPFCGDGPHNRLYRSGDLVRQSVDGSVQFVGRADSQVKLRGFRVELDEIRLAIENHDWVKNAAVIVSGDRRTGLQSLVACVELSPVEAALMDQGIHGELGDHHRSKRSRHQVRAQLSNMGCRDLAELSGRPVIVLPGRELSPEQRARVFARKTYRFYEGGEVTKADILRLLGRGVAGRGHRSLGSLSLAELGEILRYFGQFQSRERLLPKYGYASPGSLYATQLYLEIGGVAGLTPGYRYYHPVDHELVLIGEREAPAAPRILLHFIGRRRAIEPVYRTNIQEVLEIETGHMVGLFEEILPERGLDLRDAAPDPTVKDYLECADEDLYLGTFEIVPYAGPRPDDTLQLYVQSHRGRVRDLPAGQYLYRDGDLERVSDQLVLKKHVVAINQEVYDRSSIGITIVSRTAKAGMRYIELGRKLQHIQMNDVKLGFMSSGYSSKTGNDLPSARRMEAILRACGREAGASYFAVGGRVSDEQVRSEGMREDVVHMRGPAEMIRDDLRRVLPPAMVPDRVIVLDELPLTASGKVDRRALEALDETRLELPDRHVVAPRTETEERIARLWRREVGRDRVSVQDDFFESGGNSLIAVGLINGINEEFRCSLPLQVLFDSPTIEQLARRVEGQTAEPASRLVRLRAGASAPVYCWPGLGGYTMNLRLLAARGIDRTFYGVQTRGINPGETPPRTLEEMAAEDVQAIRRLQPTGPYTLWGYSFGARVAFEAAHQLERSGERVEELLLIAPGSPRVWDEGGSVYRIEPTYRSRAYVKILFSVFAGGLTHPALERCLELARDDETFASFIADRFENLDPELVKRIARVVHRTYRFGYAWHELVERWISAPITVLRARGDENSFLESGAAFLPNPPTVIHLEADHYSVLREPAIRELVQRIRARGSPADPSAALRKEGASMPHVNIKYFPVPLSDEQQSELVAAVTRAVMSAFGCDEGVISIALEPIDKEAWNERVYVPEIVNRNELLRKVPNY